MAAEMGMGGWGVGGASSVDSDAYWEMEIII